MPHELARVAGTAGRLAPMRKEAESALALATEVCRVLSSRFSKEVKP